MTTHGDLKTAHTPNWCPGCGDFGIWTAFKNACVKQGWDNTNTALVADIGCHGHIINFINISAFEGLHGRAVVTASGLKMANHRLNVFVFTGDGGSLAEGGNHFMHAARRNHDMTVIVHDNAIYGLTTGQTSPRSPKGFVTKSTPQGNIDEPLHPLRMALAAGATWLGRVYSGDLEMMEEMIVKAKEHKGFAVLQILQPCVTFNKKYTHIFYQQNMYHLGSDYDRTNKVWAFEKTMEWDVKKIPIGVFYEVQQLTQEDQLKVLEVGPLVERGVQKRDIAEMMGTYA